MSETAHLSLMPDAIQASELPRRDILAAGLFGAAAIAADNLPWLVQEAGEAWDAAVPLEKIIDKPVIALEPREYDTPIVQPIALGESTEIHAEYTGKDGAAKLRLWSHSPLRAEHTNSPLGNGSFESAGTAIITTAEGLAKGKQEYCTLFRSGEQIIAVGYENGVYAYQSALGSDKTGSNGEWVRVITQSEGNALPSPVTASWKEPATPNGMLIESIIQGTKTLSSIGYKPWSAVLPSTRMPSMVEKEITAETCAENVAEVIDGKHLLFVTRQGDIVDINHLIAKAGETFDLLLQLCYMRVSGEQSPIAGVRYSRGSNAVFEFSVDPASLGDNDLYDTAFSIMTTESMLMEGISQRYAAEKLPLIGKIHTTEGLSPEDPFTNSLGIVGMLDVIRKNGIDAKLEGPLKQIRRNNPSATTSEIREALEEQLGDIRDKLAKYVLEKTALTYGVRTQPPGTLTLPRGLYPLIPTKVSDHDDINPNRINLQSAGIRPNSPASIFRPTKVPAVEPTFEKILEMTRLY